MVVARRPQADGAGYSAQSQFCNVEIASPPARVRRRALAAHNDTLETLPWATCFKKDFLIPSQGLLCLTLELAYVDIKMSGEKANCGLGAIAIIRLPTSRSGDRTSMRRIIAIASCT